MEIRRDPQYEHPRPLFSTRVKDKKCPSSAHFITPEAILPRRILIEKFIKNGKLLCFIADNQGQPRQDQGPRQYQGERDR
jgi:hypothetical protein